MRRLVLLDKNPDIIEMGSRFDCAELLRSNTVPSIYKSPIKMTLFLESQHDTPRPQYMTIFQLG